MANPIKKKRLFPVQLQWQAAEDRVAFDHQVICLTLAITRPQ
jgi:hypothetical protein